VGKPQVKILTALPGEHSPVGPSSSDRWLNCPGSVKASAGVPNKDTDYSAEGTAAHLLSEEARKAKRPVSDWLGWTIVVGERMFSVTEEMVDAVQEFVDHCNAIPGVPVYESRVQYERWVPGGFGTNDDIRIAEPTVSITDLKFGKGHQVFAKENTQLMLYALGAVEDFSYLYDIKGFDLHISQPRLDHHDSWHISTEDLLAWANERLPRAVKEIEEGTKFVAGKWCTFCPIRSKCAVRANTGVQLMLEAGEFEDLDELETHALRAQNGLQFVTTEQMVKILPVLGVFKAWIKDLEKRAISELMAGDKIMAAAWKLVEGRSNRKWNGSEDEIAARLRREEVDPYEHKLLSVSVVEKELGKAGFKELMGDLVAKPPGKPKLVPIEDKRPAITNLAQVEFDNLDEIDD
jgi:hypothetical protein